MKYCCLLVLLSLATSSLFAQSKLDIRGTVVDTTSMPLPGATVVLMNAQDSVLVGFAISGDKGRFEIKRQSPGTYLLQVSYVGYQLQYQAVELSADDKDVNLPPIRLRASDAVLDEILVSGERIPMSIRQDTIEYQADAFKTRQGARVEDLLRKLPGVEVDRAGNIRAQGEAVQQVLVDGKEFFGNDPKIATKNLPADAVDKVQVFDKKSELATFSGIDDGNERRAINLSLKEDKKNGYFGDLEAGYGTDDRYQGKMNLNRFGKGAQLSVIGMGNNVNEQGFSLDEYINFSGGLGSFLGGANEGGRVRLDLNDAGLPLSLAQQDGILSTHAGGLNFNQDFGKRTELRSSYFFNHVNTDLDRSTRQQSLLTENGFTSEGDSKFASDNTNHRLNVNLRHRIDSFQNLGWQSSLGYNTADQENRSTRRSFNDRQEAENEGIRQFASQGDNLLLRSSLVYRRRFRKRGRLFVADASLGLRSNEAASRLDSRNTFFQQAFTDRINQRQSQDEQLNSYGLRFSYTEPLQKGRYLEFNFAHQTVDNQLDKEFYDQLPMGEQFNEELSRFYTQQYAFDRAGINFRWNRRKSKLTLGAAMQYYRLQGQLSNEVQSVRDSYVRFLPSLRYKRDFGQANELTFAYRTSIQEPSLEQLQPIVDNSDPLRQYIGNPDLIPEYIHDLELRYLLFSQFSQISLFANAGLSYTRNKITQAQSIDAQLQQVIQPLNVDEDWLARANISFGSPLRFMKSRSSVNLGSNYSRSIVFVNGQRNLVQRQSYNLEYSISNRSWDKIDFRFGADLGWNKVRYDLLQDLNQSYLSQTYFADLTVFVGKNTELNSIFDYSRYSDESFGAAQSVPLWRASITQYVFQKKGRFILSVYDILDRNLGIRRSNAFNFVQEVRSNALRRYVSLGFGWSLSGFDQKKGGIEIDAGGRRR